MYLMPGWKFSLPSVCNNRIVNNCVIRDKAVYIQVLYICKTL